MDNQTCKLDIHQEVWDLGGTLEAAFLTPDGEPCQLLHEDQAVRIRVRVHLTGRILNYLCDTQLCVTVAYESIGTGPEGEVTRGHTLTPCRDGGDTYTFDFDLPGGTLSAGECGKQYEIGITLGSKDCCGQAGFIFGTCRDFNITVVPADVN
ncbi:MAG: hypothetical protein QNM02_01115 [Acidimicrobiia bacterium]|nr:hypothetical protein [Acidimicrobiia bacterium]